jgi:sporulation protein YlmC with PRC-barrel domain
MTQIIKDTEITGKRVILEDASDIGMVTDVFVDTLDWRITRLDVKVEKRYAERLGLEKGLLKKAICPVKIHFLKSVGDVVHLKGNMDDLAKSQKRILPAAERKAAAKAAKASPPPKTKKASKGPPPPRPPPPVDEDKPRSL